MPRLGAEGLEHLAGPAADALTHGAPPVVAEHLPLGTDHGAPAHASEAPVSGDHGVIGHFGDMTDPGGGDHGALNDILLGGHHDPAPQHPADVFDPNQGSHYTSGDAHLPGGWPPGTPEATWSKGDTDPGWHYVDRGPDKNWMPYQEQIAGAERLPDGRIPEYAQVDPATGNSVNFDGHTYRDGHEVFLDSKDGYSGLAMDPGRPWTQGMEQSILNEVPRQLAALPPGATLEIHVSDPVGAAAVRNLLEANDLYGATVIYTPKAP